MSVQERGAPALAKPAGEWTVLALLRWTTGFFQERGIESARLDAECLLAEALGCDRVSLYVDFEKPVMATERDRFRELVRRRAGDRVPVAQLLGRREFWSLDFEVTPDVLTPRPETEILVGWAIDRLADATPGSKVLDVGTGSGCVALAVASELPKVQVVATDVSEAALEVARRNIASLDLGDRVQVRSGSLFEPVAGESFDCILSNPPYIARGHAGSLPPELSHEPELALFAGEDGLDVIRALLGQVQNHLKPGGQVAMEIDPRQEALVCELFEGSGLSNLRSLRDLSDNPRVVTGTRT